MSYNIHNINIPNFFPHLENPNNRHTKAIIKDVNADFDKKMTKLNKKYKKVNQYIQNFPLHKNPITITIHNIVEITITHNKLTYKFKNGIITQNRLIYDFYINKKSKMFYYTTESKNGDESYTLYAFDLMKRKIISQVKNITGDIIGAKYEGLYYCKSNKQFIVDRIYYFNNGKSTLIYKEEDSTKTLDIYRTSDRSYMIISREDYDSNQLFLIKLNSMKKQETLRPFGITTYEPYIKYKLECTNNIYYLFKNNKNVDSYYWRIIKSRNVFTLMNDKRVYHKFPLNFELETVKSYEGYLICFGYKDGEGILWRINTNKFKNVSELEIPVSTKFITVDILLNEDIEMDLPEEFPLIVDSQITHISNYIINVKSGKIRKDKEEVEVKIDPYLYDIEKVVYTNRDETEGSYLVIRNRIHETPRGLYVMVYGAYNTVAYYEGSINSKVMMDSGIFIIVPLVRGGGGFGLRHFVSGRGEYKINTIHDTIDAIKHCKKKYSVKTDKISLFGRSAGGLIATNIYVKEPKLCGLIITEVPYCDLLKTSTDDNKPLVLIEQREFGNPRESLTQLFHTAEITPFFDFERKEYPKLYLTTGINDNRVSYHEGLKFIQAVKIYNKGKQPGQLNAYVDMNSGHIMKEDNPYYNSKLLFALEYFNVSII